MPAFCGAAIGPVRPGCRDFMRNFREMEVCPDNMLPYILTGVIVFIVALCDRDSPGHPVPQESGGKGNPQRRGRGQAHHQRGHQERREQKTGSPGRSQGKNSGGKNQLRERSQGAPLRTAGAGTPAPAEGRDPGAQAGKRGAEGGVPTPPAWPTWRRPGPRSPSSRPSRWRLWNGSPATPPRRPKPT